MENKMGKERILQLLIRMSIPTIFSMFVISLYNIVDSYFISKISEKAFRAISLVFPIQTIIIAISVGTGVGANALIARYLGMDENKKANIVANNSMSISLILGLIIAIFGVVFSKTYFQIYTDDFEVIRYGVDYMQIITLLSVFLVIQIIVEKLIQATGEMIYPMLSQFMGAFINILLDPLLIFGYGPFPEMGIRGAAYATIVSQILGALFCFVYLLKKDNPIHMNVKAMALHKETIHEIYRIGGPSIVVQAIPAVLIFGLNKILAEITELAVSVLGIYFRLQSFVYMPVFGVTQATMPIIAYNYGAKSKERINDCLKYSIIISASIMALGTFIFLLFPRQLISIFNPTKEIMDMAIIALRIFATIFIPSSISIVLSTYYQGLGNGIYNLIISFLRQLVIILPLAKIFSSIDVNYTWYAWPIAEVFALLISIYFAKRIYRDKVQVLSED
ncbi:MAG: MATE family efflux transporter [Tissierellia bacterium]|nr:MATE family efflux transporter [Tissierellia bacterium]